MVLLWLYEDSSDVSDFLMSSFEFSRAGNNQTLTSQKHRLLSSTSRMKSIDSFVSPSWTDGYYFPNYTQKRVFIRCYHVGHVGRFNVALSGSNTRLNIFNPKW